MGADKQDLARRVENERPDRRNRAMILLKTMGGRFDMEILPFENFLQFTQMLDDQIRICGAQLRQSIVAGQHSAGMDAAMFGSFNVVLHVSDKDRLIRSHAVFNEDFMDPLTLVPN